MAALKSKLGAKIMEQRREKPGANNREQDLGPNPHLLFKEPQDSGKITTRSDQYILSAG